MGRLFGSSGSLCYSAVPPRATEEAEKTTTTYLDNGTHPTQGEASYQAPSLPVPAPWAT